MTDVYLRGPALVLLAIWFVIHYRRWFGSLISHVICADCAEKF